MVNKMISLPEEVYFKLKEENNASGLITNLLIDHYNKTNIELMNREQLEKFIEDQKKLKQIKQLEEEIHGNK